MRITAKHLEAKVEIINGLLGRDAGEDGEIMLYRAYGGNGVHRRNGAGVDDLLPCVPAREASAFLSGMIAAARQVS